MSDRVLVITGGQGQLGRAVIAAALARGAKVVAIDHSAVDPFESQACLEIGGVDLSGEDGHRPGPRPFRATGCRAEHRRRLCLADGR